MNMSKKLTTHYLKQFPKRVSFLVYLYSPDTEILYFGTSLKNARRKQKKCSQYST